MAAPKHRGTRPGERKSVFDHCRDLFFFFIKIALNRGTLGDKRGIKLLCSFGISSDGVKTMFIHRRDPFGA